MLASYELLLASDEKDPETLALAVIILTEAGQFKQMEMSEICDVTTMTIQRWRDGKNLNNMARPKRVGLISELKKHLDQRIKAAIAQELSKK